MNPLRALWEQHGQAIWLDSIDRRLVTEGGLARLVAADGIRGVTSNPTIFHKAITGSDAYDDVIDTLLASSPQLATDQLYEALVIEDIRAAAAVLRPVYEASDGGDGFVSLEVSPHLASDTEATVAEARRLWRVLACDNLMIKVPATAAGIPAIETLIADGINVNATLMFSLDDYEGVANAFLRGVERCADPRRVASVASFFVSRVDTAVDRRLEEIGGSEAQSLLGRAAVANACLAYRRFEALFRGGSFAALERRGARVQRPLWASTSTKNPAYEDTKYVDELIARDTVNTLPTETLDSFRDHGQPAVGLERSLASAENTFDRLAAVGVSLAAITGELQRQGVRAFADSFDKLMASLEAARLARVAG